MSSATDRAERLRTAGLKVTGPRLAILEALERTRSHPSAEEIHHDLTDSHPSLSLSTVYQSLVAFIRAGLVRRMPEVDGRLRVDGTRQPHDHAVCRRCGAISDIDRRHFPLPDAPGRLPDRLEVLSVHVEYEVICSTCRDTI